MVVLSGVEFDAPAAALACPVKRSPDQRSRDAASSRLTANEQILQPTILGGRPDAVAKAQLADARRGRIVVDCGEPELGLRSAA
jgi:hypothetical protein